MNQALENVIGETDRIFDIVRRIERITLELRNTCQTVANGSWTLKEAEKTIQMKRDHIQGYARCIEANAMWAATYAKSLEDPVMTEEPIISQSNL